MHKVTLRQVYILTANFFQWHGAKDDLYLSWKCLSVALQHSKSILQSLVLLWAAE